MALTASGEVLPAGPGAGEAIRPPSRGWIGLAGLVIILAGWAVYSNSFDSEFFEDSTLSILQNPTIQHGWREALQPPSGSSSVSGRPLVNLSLALNYRLGGFNVWGYHAFNLAIQLLAGLTLFGLVRRTLERPVLRDRYGQTALPLAFVITLLWMVHPLQTESVTYVIQRAESIMGLFYLLTLYCFVRGAESSRAWIWFTCSATACLLGMATKESMVTAPVIVLLYDRTFVAGNFTDAWRRRWKYHVVLACTWLPLAWTVATVTWPGNVSLKNPGLDGLSLAMKSYVYALKQCQAIVQYLWLSLWPRMLNFSYGKDVVKNPLEVAPQMAVLAVLLAGTIYALWRRPALGFLGAWFFVILAPTSSVVPLQGNTMAEHHMYLSLAALAVLMVLGLHALLDRRAYIAGLALALGLGGLAFERNRDYRTNVSLSSDLIEKFPDDPDYHFRLIAAFDDAGRPMEALAQHLKTIISMDSDKSAVENNMGNTFMASGRISDAIIHYQQAVRLDPNLAEPYYNLGNAYLAAGWPDRARDAYLWALRVNPNYADAHSNLGSVYLVNFGQIDQAIAEYEAALLTNPNLFQIQVNLANLYIKTNRVADAIPHYRTAIEIQPGDADAYAGLGFALLLSGQANGGIPQFETALRLSPNNAATHNNFGLALLQLDRFDDAASQFTETLRLDPHYPNAQNNLDKVRQLAGSSPPSPNVPKQ